MKLKKLTALCLCSVVLASGILAACQKGKEEIATADEATISSEQTLNTEDSTTLEETLASSSPTTAPATEPATKAPAGSNSPQSNSANNKPSNSGSNTSSDSGSNTANNQGSQTAAQSKPVTCIITVDGKDHKVTLGDTLTYTYYLKTPKKIENVQAKVNYSGTTLNLLDSVLVTDFSEISDSSALDKLNKELKGVFPVLGSSAIYNAYNRNIILFNASNISGMDFTKGDYLIKLRFEVISGINGAISTKIEYMDETGGKPYVDNSKFTDEVVWEEKLTY